MRERIEQWFINRGLQVFTYQVEQILKMFESFNARHDYPTVLAAAPSAGKTIISICFLDLYLQDHPTHRVLVLTHGQTVLRKQYDDEVTKMNVSFTHTSINLGQKEQLRTNRSRMIVTLPQTISSLQTLPKFHVLVVDEAHQRYYAKEVKGIIEKARPMHQLLLTGTPSKFIREEIPILPVTVNELLDYGMISDVLVELAASSYDFTFKDYNNSHELKEGVKIKKKDTDSTLDMLLKALVKRLTNQLFKESNKYQKWGWLRVLTSLQKTMVACKSIEQARQVEAYFKKQKIKVAKSTTGDDESADVNSLEIQRFKEEKDCLVLIVVGRGILGFNYPELVNVVDMSATQNIDRIFQLMARVLRRHPEGKQKMFVKVVPSGLDHYFEHLMTATLCLTDERYYTTYNGKNFLDMEIPVEEKRKRRRDDKKTAGEKPKKQLTIQPIDFGSLPVIQLFKDILHVNHGPLNPYAWTTMREVRRALVHEREYVTDEEIMETVQKYVA
jgi:superfamily II DNA or RNA helicase